MKAFPARTVLSVSAIAIGFLAGILAAGPLNPPSGAVASTYKTLNDVEPRIAINAANTPGDANSVFRITQAGGYYLTANLLTSAGKNGIEIAASGVTIDLNGFQISGFGGLAGIVASSTALERIVIRNGRILSCTAGVSLISIPGVVVESVSVESCSGLGIWAGADALIKECVTLGNTVGLSAGARSIVTSCRSSDNSNDGIWTQDDCTVTGCVAVNNEGVGVRAGINCTVSNCSASGNVTSGIISGVGSTVTACTSRDNGFDGINTGSGSTVSGCSVYSNSRTGIAIGSSSTISNCTAYQNTGDGILCDAQCVIRGNTCSSNGSGAGSGAGVHATGGENRIEGNNCYSGDRGIDVDVAGSIIVGNTCTGVAVSYAIAANNFYGPIIDRTGVVTAAVNGAAAAGTLASTDPNANFSY